MSGHQWVQARYMSGCKSASEYKGMDKYCGQSRHKDASGHNGTSRWNSRSRCKWAQVGASGLKSMSGYTRAQCDIRGQGGKGAQGWQQLRGQK